MGEPKKEDQKWLEIEVHNRKLRFKYITNEELFTKELTDMLWEAYRRGYYDGDKKLNT